MNRKRIGEDARMVHVSYAMTDKNGTYSKYIGASMCSLFERTDSWVTIHLLHDDTLTEKNRNYFVELTRTYGQQIFFYNVAEECKDLLAEAREIFKRAVDTDYYTPAALYRLLAPILLPQDVKRLIYLDADTIVNMDIRKFWEVFLDGNPLGAVTERTLMEHYQKQIDRSIDEKLYLFKNSWTDFDTCFNSGVLLMDLEKMRNMGEILLSGLRFIVQHDEECRFFDQDILNYFFARDFLHLPWNYNILQHWDRQWGSPEPVEGIYHYMGRTLRYNYEEPRDRIFYEAFVKTPWCDAEFICKSYAVTVNVLAGELNKCVEKNRKASTAWANRKRVFVGAKVDEEKIREMFSVLPEEPYIVMDDGWKRGLCLPYDLSTHIYVFFMNSFPELKEKLDEAGWKEWEDYIDGKSIIVPHPTRVIDEYRIFLVI
ncbi:glycosyltransferase family 8 protein [Selenomonas sp. KH1T6]|uniref:glycosyltransferase family 8 protein n=1 Tax=Selenomonas sp. KH1T6 TaxID=3158784 RepID=UPI0008A7FCCA|nr:Lipopolysaccharide biosynthesis protein, LPS:glycosyltransferase [Selenomonas ruminantium]